MGNKDLSMFGARAIFASLATGAMIFGTATACGTPATADTAVMPAAPSVGNSTVFSEQLRRPHNSLSAALAIPLSTQLRVIAIGEGTFRTSTETFEATKHTRAPVVPPRRLANT